MPSHRRASTCMALLSVLLLVVMPCTTGAVAAAEDTVTPTSYVDYFIGDLFVQNPRSMMNRDMEKALPRFRPWRIIDVPDDSVLAFDCAGDVPTLRVVPRSAAGHVDVNGDATLPPTDNTCSGSGRTQQAGTPTQYKFSRRPGSGNDTTGYSALFWRRQPSAGEEGEGAPPPPPLMPVPKFQLKAILKVVAAMMELSWRKERGDGAVPPESVAFSGNMVVFYFDFNDRDPRWLVVMGREDVEFRQPWERLHGEIKALNLGTVV